MERRICKSGEDARVARSKSSGLICLEHQFESTLNPLILAVTLERFDLLAIMSMRGDKSFSVLETEVMKLSKRFVREAKLRKCPEQFQRFLGICH